MTDTELETPMGWRLFLVDRVLSTEEIASTFGEIFDLEPEDILVITAAEEPDDELPENIGIVCEKKPVKGDFKLSLTIYFQENDLEEIVDEMGGEIEVITRFANILDCACLIIDPSIINVEDEDACLLVQSGDNNVQEVYLDFDRLNSEEYIVVANISDSIATFLSKDILWEPTERVETLYQAKVDDCLLELSLNDFPEEYLYTLFVNSIPIYQLNDLPSGWIIP
jgi:hypothetical protein